MGRTKAHGPFDFWKGPWIDSAVPFLFRGSANREKEAKVVLVVMKKGATPVEIEAVVSGIEQKGCIARPIPGGERVAICVLHNNGPVDARHSCSFPG